MRWLSKNTTVSLLNTFGENIRILSLIQEFLNLSTVSICGWIILFCGWVLLCVVGCLAASLASTCWQHSSSDCDNKKCLQKLPSVPWGQNSPWLRITELYEHNEITYLKCSVNQSFHQNWPSMCNLLCNLWQYIVSSHFIFKYRPTT